MEKFFTVLSVLEFLLFEAPLKRMIFNVHFKTRFCFINTTFTFGKNKTYKLRGEFSPKLAKRMQHPGHFKIDIQEFIFDVQCTGNSWVCLFNFSCP